MLSFASNQNYKSIFVIKYITFARYLHLGALMRLTNFFVKILSLVVIAMVTSCQPKDIDLRGYQAVSVTSKDQKSTPMTDVETNNVLAVAIERTIEPLHFLKATLNNHYAAQFDLERISIASDVETDELSEEILRTKIVDVSKNEKKNRVTNSDVLINYKIDEFSVDPSGKLRKLVLQKNIFQDTKQTSYKDAVGGGKRDDFQSESVNERLVIRPAAADNVYIVKLTRIENTNSKKDKKTVLKTESKLKIVWNGQNSTLDEAIKILSIEINVQRLGEKTGQVVQSDEQPELSVRLGQCVSIEGRMKYNPANSADSKITNPDEIILTDSTVQILSKKYKSQALPCETRPVVDLARLL